MWKRLWDYLCSAPLASASSQDLYAEELSENLKGNTNMNVVTLTECGTSLKSSSESVITLDRQTGLIAQTAINSLLNSRYFSICTLEKVIDLTNMGSRNSDAYKKLTALHCVDYSDMPKELRDQIPIMINELLLGEEHSPATKVAMQGISY